MLYKVFLLSFILSLFMVTYANAQDLIQHEDQAFCINQKLGWNFYCDKIKAKKTTIKKLPKQQIIRSIPKNKPKKIVKKILGKEEPKLDKNIDPQTITKARRTKHISVTHISITHSSITQSLFDRI